MLCHLLLHRREGRKEGKNAEKKGGMREEGKEGERERKRGGKGREPLGK